MRNSLVIFGAWYFSDVVAELAITLGWEVCGRIDPDPPPGITSLDQVPESASCYVAIGDNAQRKLVFRQLERHGRNLVSLLHPSAQISPSGHLGRGAFIAENAVVRTSAELGDGVMVNSGAVISHHCRVGDFVLFGPNSSISSRAAIGSESMIGVGASVCPQCNIGKRCVVGAGAVVVADVADGTQVVGNPARPLPSNDTGRVQKLSDWSAHQVW